MSVKLFCKGPIVNILGFVGYMVAVTITHSGGVVQKQLQMILNLMSMAVFQ